MLSLLKSFLMEWKPYILFPNEAQEWQTARCGPERGAARGLQGAGCSQRSGPGGWEERASRGARLGEGLEVNGGRTTQLQNM